MAGPSLHASELGRDALSGLADDPLFRRGCARRLSGSARGSGHGHQANARGHVCQVPGRASLSAHWCKCLGNREGKIQVGVITDYRDAVVGVLEV
jgi:hypothetical protein